MLACQARPFAVLSIRWTLYWARRPPWYAAHWVRRPPWCYVASPALPLFKMLPKNCDLRCVLHPAPSGAGCKTRPECRIIINNPFLFILGSARCGYFDVVLHRVALTLSPYHPNPTILSPCYHGTVPPGHFIDASFNAVLCKRILGLDITISDLQEEDRDIHRSMLWMLENDITDILDSTFSADHDYLGGLKTIDLIPNGRNIPVCHRCLPILLLPDRHLSAFLESRNLGMAASTACLKLLLLQPSLTVSAACANTAACRSPKPTNTRLWKPWWPGVCRVGRRTSSRRCCTASTKSSHGQSSTQQNIPLP